MTHFRLFPSDGQAQDEIRPGIWLLEASAGTGKTYAIAGLVARLVIEEGLSLDRIAVMTFTRAATAQLRERIRNVLAAVLALVRKPVPKAAGGGSEPFIAWLGQQAASSLGRQRVRAALNGLDASPIVTIHGFCQRLLNAHGLALGTPRDVELGHDADQWRSDWCREQLRHWGCDAAVRPWFEWDLVPNLDALESWARLYEQYPDCRMAQTSDIPRFAALLSALDDARQLFVPEVIGNADIDQRRIAAAVALCAGRGSRDDLETLAKLPPKLTNSQPKLAHVAAVCAQAMMLGEILEIRFLHDYGNALARRLGHSDGILVFQDLLMGVAEGLRAEQGGRLTANIAASYDAVLVDEFQDTDALQWEILQRCFGQGAHRLVLIGDPKQAIYRFRGADVETYLAAKLVVPKDNQRTLATNYRTDRSLHDAVQRLFQQSPDPFCHPGITLCDVHAQCEDRFQPGMALARTPLEVVVVEPAGNATLSSLIRHVAAVCARHIDALLSSGSTISTQSGGRRPVSQQDIAVLVSSHAEGDSMHKALRALGIAAVTHGRESVFASLEALELRALLRAWLEPKRASVHDAALTRLGGLTPAQVQEGSSALAAFVQLCASCAERWHQSDLLSAWYAWQDQAKGSSRLAALAGGERALVNLQHLVDILAQEQCAHQRSALGTLAWLEQNIAGSGDQRTQEHLLPRLDRDDEAVRIMTIHVSKGLEFPITIVPFAWIGKQWRKTKVVMDHGSRTWVAGAGLGSESPHYYAERLAEQARLLYVALTRAQHRCMVVWCGHMGGQLKTNLTYSLGSALGVLLIARGRPFADVIAEWKPISTSAALTSTGCAALLRAGIVATSCVARGDGRSSQAATAADDGGAIPIYGRSAQRMRWPSSYSSLVRRIETDDDRDVDRQAATHDTRPATSQTAQSAVDMPSGAEFGIVMHAVFERALRQDDPLAGFAEQATTLLVRAGVDAAVIPLVVERIRHFLVGTLPGGSSPLAAIPRSVRGVEVPFALPVLAAADIASAFAAHPLADYPHYERRLHGLQLPPGLFNGVIDLVVKDGDAWHVVDWKSNRLPNAQPGADAITPDQQALCRNMRDHHYPLQYALYAVALRRLLRMRSLGTPQRLGCAHYAYVRYGSWVSADLNPGLIDALDAAMGGGAHG